MGGCHFCRGLGGKGVDAGVDLPLIAAAFAVRDPDQTGGLECVQIALDRPNPDAVEIREVFIAREAVAALVCQGADLRIEQLRPGRDLRTVADLCRNDRPVAGFHVFRGSHLFRGDADADAAGAPASVVGFAIDRNRGKCYYDGVLIASAIPRSRI